MIEEKFGHLEAHVASLWPWSSLSQLVRGQKGLSLLSAALLLVQSCYCVYFLNACFLIVLLVCLTCGVADYNSQCIKFFQKKNIKTDCLPSLGLHANNSEDISA